MDIELLSLDRLPLPSLEVYAMLSVMAASCSAYYLWTQSALFYVQMLGAEEGLDPPSDLLPRLPPGLSGGMGNGSSTNPSSAWHALHWASQQPHCLWPVVNLVYCLLLVLSLTVQRRLFGSLRAVEQNNVKDHFWNLVFYKVVFVFGVVNVQELEDALGWTFFVSLLVLLHVARQLARDRHNYLIMMNDGTREGELRRRGILGFLFFIFMTSIGLFLGVGAWYWNSAPENPPPFPFESEEAESVEPSLDTPYDFHLGLHSTLFMLCEIGLLVVQTFHALTVCVFDQVTLKYTVRLQPNQSETESEAEEEELQPSPQHRDEVNASISHSINFYFDLTALLFDLVHHVHMLVCCNLFLSMTSLIVSLQMRARVRQIHGILKKRQSYTWLSQHIDQYPDLDLEAEEDEGDAENNCAICWDSIRSQNPKVLPCRHTFHTGCLRKWLLVSMNCPTCRLCLLNDGEVGRSVGRRLPRRLYNPRDNGFWGFLQTGQTLLDLFGGWDPTSDEGFPEVSSPPRPSLLNFGVQDWNVPTASTRSATTSTETQKQD